MNKTKISAEIVADSICNGHRITTMKVVMPRKLLAEAKTHRVISKTDEGLEHIIYPGIGFNDDPMLSKNSASSRAIPLEKMIKAVENDPFIPIAWQKDHSGMQGTQYLNEKETAIANRIHLRARDEAIRSAKALKFHKEDGIDEPLNVTKQLCNRYLEPFMWHTVLVTATEWENFFALRCPRYLHEGSGTFYRSRKDYLNRQWEDHQSPFDDGIATDLDWLQLNKGQAEIHMMALAEAMWDARNESTPRELEPGQWHIPFGDQIDLSDLKVENFYQRASGPILSGQVKTGDELLRLWIATARAARVSYTVVGEITPGTKHISEKLQYQKDIELHDRLAASGHWSPFEHCARAMTWLEYFPTAFGSALQGRTDEDLMQVAEKNVNNPHVGWCKNFRGWIQYRAMFPGENKV